MFEPKKYQPRSIMLGLRVTEQEHQILHAAAKAEGADISKLLRKAISFYLAAEDAERQPAKKAA